MKKLTVISSLALILMFGIWLVAPALALAQPDIEVDPLEYDFGDIAVGESDTTIISISNVGKEDLEVSAIGFEAGSSKDFWISMMPTLPEKLKSGAWFGVGITFSPTSRGYLSAVLQIDSDDPDEPRVWVDLGGVGNGDAPPPVTIADILEFFDQSVEEGTLQGRGIWPCAAKARLKAFRCLLVWADTLIERGYMGWACFILERAFLRSDGLFRPPDFVAGEARPRLNAMIIELMADLECPPEYYAYVSYNTDEEGTNWIELQLVDEYGNPMANEEFQVTLSDGTIVDGKLDENGSARIKSVDSGPALIDFPDLDPTSLQIYTD